MRQWSRDSNREQGKLTARPAVGISQAAEGRGRNATTRARRASARHLVVKEPADVGARGPTNKIIRVTFSS